MHKPVVVIHTDLKKKTKKQNVYLNTCILQNVKFKAIIYVCVWCVFMLDDIPVNIILVFYRVRKSRRTVMKNKLMNPTCCILTFAAPPV